MICIIRIFSSSHSSCSGGISSYIVIAVEVEGLVVNIHNKEIWMKHPEGGEH